MVTVTGAPGRHFKGTIPKDIAGTEPKDADKNSEKPSKRLYKILHHGAPSIKK
jgi:hypothetical protein